MIVLCAILLEVALSDVKWNSDYLETISLAKEERKFVFVAFGETDKTFWLTRVPKKQLDDYVLVRQPLDSFIEVKDKKVRLLEHRALRHLVGKAGFAIIDYKHDGPNYGKVVSVLPAERVTNLSRLLVLFDLPRGSLSQRTLIWAIRVHPEHPQSTAGKIHPKLLEHAARHSRTQARRNLQHHDLPDFATSEIVAESWPWNKDVVAAALDIVDAWSQSPGHWREASRPHRFFAYDMYTIGRKWFATGVFID